MLDKKIEPRLHGVLGARRHCAAILARIANDCQGDVQSHKRSRDRRSVETLGLPGNGHRTLLPGSMGIPKDNSILPDVFKLVTSLKMRKAGDKL